VFYRDVVYYVGKFYRNDFQCVEKQRLTSVEDDVVVVDEDTAPQLQATEDQTGEVINEETLALQRREWTDKFLGICGGKVEFDTVMNALFKLYNFHIKGMQYHA
jgi:hypothetical protein